MIGTERFLFGEADPARFGIGFTEGSNISTTLKDPLKTAKDYIPAGGAIYNIGKTGYNYLFPKEGVVGVYDEDDKMRFPLRTNPASIAQSALFGEYSSPEAQRSFDEKIYALGKEDTRKVQNAIKGGISPQLAYEVITEFRKLRKPMDKIEYIEGLSVSEEEKSLIFQYLYHGYGGEKMISVQNLFAYGLALLSMAGTIAALISRKANKTAEVAVMKENIQKIQTDVKSLSCSIEDIKGLANQILTMQATLAQRIERAEKDITKIQNKCDKHIDIRGIN